MKTEFLYQVAELFWKKEGDNIKDYCFVFPNTRSSLFFQKYLGIVAARPVMAPVTVTINSLFSLLSGLRTADKISSLVDLYTQFTIRYEGSKSESFDDFLFWGDMILNDFDDIDKYLVDAKKLFSNIEDLHDLDSGYDFLSDRQKEAIEKFWNHFIPYSDKPKEQSFLSVWNCLYQVYNDFKESLRSRGEGYEGMIYRTVAESVASMDSLPASLRQYKKIVFVGLNALNKCEKALLDFLKREDAADFYWDYFGEIIKDKDNKSSLFMDENIRRYPSKFELQDSSDIKKEIEVIGIPSAVGQAKYLNKILNELFPGESYQDEAAFSTAVVLPDENLLMPVINSIPDKIENINVTMGYSLVNTQVSAFMELIMQLRKKVRLDGASISFYHSTVTSILTHPFIINNAKNTASDLKKKIIAKNMVFVPYQELMVDNPLIDIIFKPLSDISLNTGEKISCIADYQMSVLNELQKSLNSVEKEFVFAYYKCINRLKGLNLPIEQDTYFTLLKQIVSSVSIPFKGEPLSGLQIMGPLETRALDFENVIILSVNEGVFPSAAVSSSFIPYNLRKGFDLPNYEFQDSISAYHFYRSIYRAKRVFLLYDTRTEGVGKTGEVSRFVKQLKFHHRVPLKEFFISYKMSVAENRLTSVSKTEEMLKVIENKCFSPSSINTYLDCPLKFYFQQIENIRDEEEVEEDVQYSSFGSLYHQVMEKLYLPYKGKVVNLTDLDVMIDDTDKITTLIGEAFLSILEVKQILGKNKIIEALLVRFVKQTLEKDKEVAPFTLKATEMRCEAPFITPQTKRKISLYGIIDRIDRTAENLRIIDYKTGNYYIANRQIEDLFDSSSENRAKSAFQLIFYLLLLKKNGKVIDVTNTEMDIISLKDIFRSSPSKIGITESDFSTYESMLGNLLEDIFNPNIPFTTTDNVKICEWCPCKVICNR